MNIIQADNYSQTNIQGQTFLSVRNKCRTRMSGLPNSQGQGPPGLDESKMSTLLRALTYNSPVNLKINRTHNVLLAFYFTNPIRGGICF